MQHQDVYEIKSSLILQPGPAALTDGLDELHRIVERWASGGRSGKKAAIPHVMKSADKKQLETLWAAVATAASRKHSLRHSER